MRPVPMVLVSPTAPIAGLVGGGPKPPVRLGMLAEVHGADVHFGDAARTGHASVVRDGRFELVP